MRKRWAWGLAAALCLGFTASSGWAGDDDEDSTGPKAPPRPAIRWSPYFARMAAYTEQKPTPIKPQAKPKKEAAKKQADATKPVKAVDDAAAERAREEANLIRRLEVCDKLKEIALRTNDQELLRRAEALDERARTTYAQRTSYLRGGAGGFESDEKTLDKHTGSANSTRTRSLESSAHSVPGSDLDSRAAIKEVNP